MSRNSKLPLKKVNQILLYKDSGLSHRKVAVLLGVGPTSVRYIWNGKRRSISAIIPECHPERKHWAHSKCQQCYKRDWQRMSESNKMSKINYERREGHKNNLKKYNLTTNQYDQMFKAQGGKCLICLGDETNKRNKNFTVDHDHKTNKIRGLLCSKCNLFLGLVDDNIKILSNAISYLESNIPDDVIIEKMNDKPRET